MRETRSSGSVEGVMSNRDPYSACQTRFHCFEPLFRFLKIFSWHLPALLLEAVKNINHIIYPR